MMVHVTIYYKMFVASVQHRRPRNTSIELNLTPRPGGGDYSIGGEVYPLLFYELPYTLPSRGSGMAKLQFWSVTDGMNGEVRSPTGIFEPPPLVGRFPLTITAWYFPITGPAGIGRPAIIDDAFSANLGRFIDDTFVDVTPPRYTNEANVIGVVPTDEGAVTLVAKRSVSSTPEPFSKWILNGDFMVEGDATLNIDKGTTGIAIAIYQQGPPVRFSQRGLLSIWPFPPGSITDPLWWPTVVTRGGPPEPWVQGLTAALGIGSTASDASPQLQARILEAALQQVRIAASALQKQIKTLQKE
jgi:hypothetical protein